MGLFSVLGSFIILVISPFFLGLEFPQGILFVVRALIQVDLLTIVTALFAGMLFIWALIGFYNGIKVGEVSRVAPAIGAFVAVFTFIFAQVLLLEKLFSYEVFAFFFLVAGGVLISLKISKKELLSFNKQELVFTFSAAFLFAISWTLKKMVFLNHNFIIGFLWINSGMFVGALMLLLFADFRKEIFSRPAKVPGSKKLIFIFNQGVGGTASVFQNLAVALGSVTLVNGLQGMENFFLLVIAFVLAIKFPKVLKEEFHGFVVWQKLGAVVLIGIGLYILSKSFI